MTEREQQRICSWNQELAGANNRLCKELAHVRQERDELSDTNANLQAKLSAADGLLGAAMDEALRARRL
jgi:hypothetical protein